MQQTASPLYAKCKIDLFPRTSRAVTIIFKTLSIAITTNIPIADLITTLPSLKTFLINLRHVSPLKLKHKFPPSSVTDWHINLKSIQSDNAKERKRNKLVSYHAEREKHIVEWNTSSLIENQSRTWFCVDSLCSGKNKKERFE